MRLLLWIFFLLPSMAVAQKTLEVQIDSIRCDRSDALVTRYDIQYRITNHSGNPVSFFLHPDTTIANAASSMTTFTVYKIYQNNVFQDMDGPFFPDLPERREIDKIRDFNTAEAKAYLQKLQQKYDAERASMWSDYRKAGGTSTNESWVMRHQNLLRSKMTLNAGETKSYTIMVQWNRIRLVTTGDLEFYLNDKDRYEFELILDLKKTAFKGALSDAEFTKINNDPNFLEGLFVSNRKMIDFGP